MNDFKDGLKAYIRVEINNNLRMINETDDHDKLIDLATIGMYLCKLLEGLEDEDN